MSDQWRSFGATSVVRRRKVFRNTVPKHGWVGRVARTVDGKTEHMACSPTCLHTKRSTADACAERLARSLNTTT